MHVHTGKCIWKDDKYLSKDHARSISKHSRSSTLRPSACNCPQMGVNSKIHETTSIRQGSHSLQTELTVLVSLLSFAYSQKSGASQKHHTPDWPELVYSQGHKAEQSQQTLEPEREDSHVPTTSFQAEDKPPGSPERAGEFR